MEDLEKIKPNLITIRLFQDGNLFFENKFSKKTLIVGRDQNVDLIIEDRAISRKHMQIDCEDNKVFVSDMGSANGVYVDTNKINTRTEVNSNTHVRIGRVIIQLIPEISSNKNTKNASEEKPAKIDQSELTLSRIAFQVEEAVSRVVSKNEIDQSGSEYSVANRTDEISAMVDANIIAQMLKVNGETARQSSKKIEALVLWSGQIYQIHEFSYHEPITIGPAYNDSIHIPSLPFRWSLSNYNFQEAIFQVPKNLNVFAIRGQQFLSKEQLTAEKRLKETPNTLSIQISFYDILRIEIDAVTQLYFRYVPSTIDLDTKKFLNPDELVKKALIISLIVHFVLAIFLFFIPKDKIIAPPKKPPERIAKLIVEEKPVLIPLPEPPPPPPPPPEPPPEEKKPEPPPEPKKPEPPPEPPKPKKVDPPKPPPKLEPPKPKKLEPPPKPVQKTQQVVQKPITLAPPPKPLGNPIGNNKPAGPAPKAIQVATPQPVTPAPVPTPPAPPPPKPIDISKLGALAAMSGMKLDAKSTRPVPTNVNIAANTNTTTQSEIGTSAITSELKSQTAGAAASNSTNTGGPIKTKGTGSVAGSGYGTEGLGTGTGKRGVKGGVVGQPTLATGVRSGGRTEGLSREQVLKAMQAYLSKIQSCYERSLLSDPNLAGRIEFEWNIGKNGSVTSVDIKKNSVAGGEQLGDCVAGVIRSIKFPTSGNGEETNPSIGFPFGRL